MLNMTFRSLMLAGALTFSIAAHAADDTKKEDPVVAEVNGDKIYYSDLLEAQQAMGQQAQAMPLNVIQGLLINSIVDRKLVAASARKEGVAETESYKKRLQSIEEHLLQREFLTSMAEKETTEDAVKEAYEDMFKATEGQQEVHARHILVEKEDEAKAVIKELEGGADFVELAKTKSTGPSGPNGGDLGYFGMGAMVPAFEAAAFKLEKGAFTKEPVKTQFGYHVILVEDKRDQEPPKLEDVRDQIEGQIANKVVSDYVAGLRKSAEIKLFDESGKEVKQEK